MHFFYYYYYHTLAISRSGKNKNTSASIRGPFSLSLSLSEIRVVASNLYGSHHTHTLGTLVFITLELILSMCVCVDIYYAHNPQRYTPKKKKKKNKKNTKRKKQTCTCVLLAQKCLISITRGIQEKWKFQCLFFLLPFPKTSSVCTLYQREDMHELCCCWIPKR
jgi:hypothetical protein